MYYNVFQIVIAYMAQARTFGFVKRAFTDRVSVSTIFPFESAIRLPAIQAKAPYDSFRST